MQMAKSTGEILKKLRAVMKNKAYVPEIFSAYIVPSGDAHQSEYIAPCDSRREFISGFSGSAGTAVVTENKALLWTDGRYFLQAQKQLDNNWTLMKDGIKDTPAIEDWIVKELKANSFVGADPWLMSFEKWENIRKKLKHYGIYLVKSNENLVDIVWREYGKPEMPNDCVFIQPLSYSGQKWKEKVLRVQRKMKEKSVIAVVLTALDEIAWLFNLRGSDIAYNPVFMAYAIVTSKEAFLFIDDSKLSEDIYEHLGIAGGNRHSEVTVKLKSYGDLARAVDQLVNLSDGKIWISRSSSAALNMLVPKNRRVAEMSPVARLKAIKNPVEIRGMKNAHIKDATALCQFFCWLEKEVPKGKQTEISAAEKLESFRRELDDFVSLSFATISASGPNAAIIHYRPSDSTNRRLTVDEMYLCDSGAQFRDGTTDVTRTFHFGKPSDHQKKCFTRVLKGHIALAKAVFPNKTKGSRIDSYARYSLWEGGLDYRHGTGHGVGAFLNVHEGPQGIGTRTNDEPLEAGVFVSDEPGYYEDGAFGVRIESVILVIPVTLENNFMGGGFIGFEPVTLVDWLNYYHEKCRETIGQVLLEQGKMDAHRWLVKETEPLG
ncbi:xaa-Pro aminopeptidase 1-like isoform X2 [Xenia sp. Carnegie-2017]|uniref:xaa-Pro aminopeptidase 1-like isoform X2 n=1 Tax=Xenia sp. Carnegie-2017 TaxID=2897299 RepID=UPI001F040B0E|nr:xaa-Pro aminopeptidase 1-like isoform X2 [Xenia sp. Carnegie-2017]